MPLEDILNVVDFAQNGDWQDLAQAGLAAVVVFGTGGGIVVGAGVVLSMWEIYEVFQDASGSS